MSTEYAFQRYRGDGKPPPDAAPITLSEEGAYQPSEELVAAVNAALAAELPLLVTGEPGTGKTALAESIAFELGLGNVLRFHTRSDHRARDLLYTFDSVRRFYDANVLRETDAKALDAKKYVRSEALGEAILSDRQRVVLVDEIDKAPRDFPNDLLNVIDKMVLEVAETGERTPARHRPIVIITSNGERQLPEPFLRRCVFHRLEFPTPERLRRILQERLKGKAGLENLADVAVKRFMDLKEKYGGQFQKSPSTAELLVWVKVLLKAGVRPGDLESGRPPYLGVLLKVGEDLERVQRGEPAVGTTAKA